MNIRLDELFGALADATRLRMAALLQHGELCGCDIQYVLGVSQPNVSRHLASLKHSGLVEDRRDGNRIFYRLAETGDRTRRLLFEFLRRTTESEAAFHADSEKLKKAIAGGACTLSQWQPYAAIAPAPQARGRK